MKRIIILITILISVSILFAGTVHLKVAEFNPLESVPDFSKEGLQREAIKGEYDYFLVQFNSKITPFHRNELEALGAEIFDYIPDNGFIVRLNTTQFTQLKDKSFVRFMQIWQPAYRISPNLVYNKQEPMKNEEAGVIKLTVSPFRGEDPLKLKEALESIDGVRIIKGKRIFRIAVPAERTEDIAKTIANMPSVYWVERFYPPVLHNDWSRWIMDTFDTLNMDNGSGQWYAQLSLTSAADSARMQLYAHGLYGQGQIVGDDDTGLDWDCVFFRDPAESVIYDKDDDDVCETVNLNHRKVIAYNVPADADTFDYNEGHGTHTCGSAVGDSLGSDVLNSGILPAGNGMAPLAQIAFYDLGDGSSLTGLPTDFGDIYRWLYSAGAKITTSSWGYSAGGPGNYTQDAQNIDWVGWNNKDLCMFRSAGNSNNANPPDSVNAPATAKNIVTVGATESGFGSGSTTWSSVGTTTRNELLDVAEFSSHGPSAEGQMKPELCGVGGWYIWSALSDGDLSTNNFGVENKGGTSMSTPTTAGFGAIVRQYYEEGWYPSGTKNAGDGFAPSGALVKAMLINSTRNSPGAYSIDDIDNSGTQNAPSMGQGWGRVVMADAIYFDGDIRDLWVADETTGFSAAGESNTYTINTGPSTSEYIKIVLVWTDYPAGVSPSTVVVNDLDLEVDAGGSTYLGNVFGTNARSVTGGSADTKNVQEVVWLDAVPNSSITIRVNASNIPSGPQPYALVATGDFEPVNGNRPDMPSIFKLFDYARDWDDTPELSFSSSDPEGDSIIYRVLYDTDPAFGSPDSFTTANQGSGDTVYVSFPTALSDNTTYWWKVKASDPNGSGLWTASTAERSFTVFTSLGTDNCSWYQTTNDQFSNNMFSNTSVSGDSIILNPSGSIGTDTLVDEDFEDQATDFMVTDEDGDGYTWYIAATGQGDLGGYEPPGAGSYYAYYSDDDAGSGNTTAEEYLWMPIQYIGVCDTLKLTYGWGFNSYNSSDYLAAYYRTYKSGSWGSWQTIATYPDDGSGTETVDLTAELPCESLDVYWYYDDGADWSWAAAVDNIMLIRKTVSSSDTGSVTTAPVYYNDLANTYTRSDWGYINWREASTSDSILVHVEYNSSGSWALIPDTDLGGNSTGFTTSDETGSIDISGMSTSTYDSIRAVFKLTRNNAKSATDPAIYEIEIGNPSSSITKVSMTNISADYTDGAVTLKWRTSHESDNAKWIIERSSVKEGSYSELSTVSPRSDGQYKFIDKKVESMKEYYYKVKAVDNNGGRQAFGPVKVITGRVPLVFGLSMPSPSVFSNTTTIRYQVPRDAHVDISVYDISGRMIRGLVNTTVETGFHAVKWNGRDDNGGIVPSGTYFIRMKSDKYIRTNKSVLIK